MNRYELIKIQFKKIIIANFFKTITQVQVSVQTQIRHAEAKKKSSNRTSGSGRRFAERRNSINSFGSTSFVKSMLAGPAGTGGLLLATVFAGEPADAYEEEKAHKGWHICKFACVYVCIIIISQERQLIDMKKQKKKKSASGLTYM